MPEIDLEKLAAEIPATARLASPALRAAVLRTWAAALARSPYVSLASVPQAPHIPARGLLHHVNEVNERALELLRAAEREYALKPDRDVTLATAILHDVDKPLLYRWDGAEFAYAPGRRLQDHGAVGAQLCLDCGVPPEIAELVRVHSAFASEGLPGTVEGTIVHYADLVSTDLAAVAMGSWTIHASMRLVPKTQAEG
jgi:putative nucleotidyltransferase with HDIG domain